MRTRILNSTGLCLGTTCLVSMLAGCSPSELEFELDEESTTEADVEAAFDEFVETQAELRADGTYLIEGDMLFTDRDQLRAYFEKAYDHGNALMMKTTSNGALAKWGSSQALNLTYCISNTFRSADKARVVSAMQWASQQWQAYGRVQFKYLSQYDGNCINNSAVLFDVRPDYSCTDSRCFGAVAFFPDQQLRAGRNITVTAYGLTFESTIRFPGLIAHELGHVLGFGHEHYRPEARWTDPSCAAPAGWTYRPITTYDPFSVMHYFSCGGKGAYGDGSPLNNRVLSIGDKFGIQTAYGPANPYSSTSSEVTYRNLCPRSGWSDHLGSSGPTVPSGCWREGPVGVTRYGGSLPVPDRILYNCSYWSGLGLEYFSSTDPRCEGQQTVSQIGAVFSWQAPSTHPVYRCQMWNGEHFDSLSSSCEGYRFEHLHGYMY